MIVTTKKYESIYRILFNEANEDGYTLVEGALKPQSLGITSFTAKNSLTKVNRALSDAVSNGKISENVSSLCKILCKAVSEKKPDDQVNVIDKLIEGEPYMEEIEITFKENTKAAKAIKLLSADKIKNAIIKDFGEILGPIFLLNLIAEANRVAYSNDKQEKVKDYTIQTNDKLYWNVSAKALKKANAPSVSGLIEAIQNSGQDTINKLLEGENQTVSELKWLVDMLQEKSLSRDQWISIVNRYSYYDEALKSAFNNFKSFFNISDKSQYDPSAFESLFDKKCESDLEGVKALIKNEWDALNISSNKVSVKLNEDLNYFKSLENSTKIGIFMYPIIKRTVLVMNEHLGILGNSEETDVDIFTKVVRYYFDGYKQLYLDVRLLEKGIKFVFKMIEMGKCNWTLVYDKSTMNNPYTRLQMQVVAN